jgi:hypothetical protein
MHFDRYDTNMKKTKMSWISELQLGQQRKQRLKLFLGKAKLSKMGRKRSFLMKCFKLLSMKILSQEINQ